MTRLCKTQGRQRPSAVAVSHHGQPEGRLDVAGRQLPQCRVGLPRMVLSALTWALRLSSESPKYPKLSAETAL